MVNTPLRRFAAMQQWLLRRCIARGELVVSSGNVSSAFLVEKVLELLWPTRCVSCDKPGYLICPQCVTSIRIADPSLSCLCCGAPFGRILCTECERTPWSVHPVRAVGTYEPPLSSLIKVYKDQGEQRISYVIAQILAWYASLSGMSKDDFDVATYIPATREARRRRGFDHMELITQYFSHLSGICAEQLILKHKTEDQRKLNKEERLRNVFGSFEITASVKGRRILLIDDVITTGATLKSAGYVLRQAGADSVEALCLARVW